MLTGFLKVLRLPPQCTFWRFLASLHLSVAGQIQRVQRTMRQRVWQAAHVDLKTITLDTDTTVHTLFGHQMGGRKGYKVSGSSKMRPRPSRAAAGNRRRRPGIRAPEIAGRPFRAGSRPNTGSVTPA